MSDEIRRRTAHPRPMAGRRNGYADHAVRSDSRDRGRANNTANRPRASDEYDHEASIARSYKMIEEIYGADWRKTTVRDSGHRPEPLGTTMFGDDKSER